MTAEEFKAARAKLGWTQDELGRRLRVTDRAISYWETGEKPVPVLVSRWMRSALALFGLD